MFIKFKLKLKLITINRKHLFLFLSWCPWNEPLVHLGHSLETAAFYNIGCIVVHHVDGINFWCIYVLTWYGEDKEPDGTDFILFLYRRHRHTLYIRIYCTIETFCYTKLTSLFCYHTHLLRWATINTSNYYTAT